jgi:hypothetical protein
VTKKSDKPKPGGDHPWRQEKRQMLKRMQHRARHGQFEFSGKWLATVVDLPETGMGYTVVAIELRDGRMFEQVLIDSGVVVAVRGVRDIPFTEDDIVKIVPNHRKWDWAGEWT